MLIKPRVYIVFLLENEMLPENRNSSLKTTLNELKSCLLNQEDSEISDFNLSGFCAFHTQKKDS